MAKIIVLEETPSASQEEQDRRQSICDSCPQYNSETDTCQACGCMIEHKKFQLDDTCPEGKWNVN